MQRACNLNIVNHSELFQRFSHLLDHALRFKNHKWISIQFKKSPIVRWFFKQFEDFPKQFKGFPIKFEGSPKQFEGYPKQFESCPIQFDGSTKQFEGCSIQFEGFPIDVWYFEYFFIFLQNVLHKMSLFFPALVHTIIKKEAQF